MVTVEDIKKFKDSGIFEDLKKSGVIPSNADLDEVIKVMESSRTASVSTRAGELDYWAWGSRGCWHKPPVSQ